MLESLPSLTSYGSRFVTRKVFPKNLVKNFYPELTPSCSRVARWNCTSGARMLFTSSNARSNRICRSLGSALGTVQRCLESSVTYVFSPLEGALEPVADFVFPIEVYEQGRIHRLREDASRQLDMLDEFAGLGALKEERSAIVTQLRDSASATPRSLRPRHPPDPRARAPIPAARRNRTSPIPGPCQ